MRAAIFLALLATSLSVNATCYTSKASYYKRCFGTCETANGERFKPNKISAAHKILPFNTKVTVTNLHNNKTIKVRINDRGPYIKGRDIDLSLGAMKALKGVKRGVIKIKYCF